MEAAFSPPAATTAATARPTTTTGGKASASELAHNRRQTHQLLHKLDLGDIAKIGARSTQGGVSALRRLPPYTNPTESTSARSSLTALPFPSHPLLSRGVMWVMPYLIFVKYCIYARNSTAEACREARRRDAAAVASPRLTRHDPMMNTLKKVIDCSL